MVDKIRSAWSDIKHTAFLKAADVVVWGATLEARRKLKGTPIVVLLDNSTIHDAVTHETVWINTGTELWGGEVPIETGYSARIPVHSHQNESGKYNEVRFIIGIAELARRGAIKLRTSGLLELEHFRAPPGRWRGYGLQDLSVLAGIETPFIDGDDGFFNVFASNDDIGNALDSNTEEPFNTLKKFFDAKQSFDVWHLHTAHKYGAHCFLTTDNKFVNAAKQAARRTGYPPLNSRPMLPSELASELGLNPIHSFVVSYRDQVFAARHDLHLPDEKRTHRSRFRKST